jgi:hypothetical protein
LSNFAKSHNKLTRLSVTLCLFLAAILLDYKLSSLSIYPIYLPSILYAGVNFSFIFSVPLSAIAALLSVLNEGLDYFSTLYTFAVRLILLLIISFLFSAYIGLVKTYRLRFELLKTLIPQCPDCGAILCLDGEWRQLETISGEPDLIGSIPVHNCKIKSVSPFINKS